MRKANIYELYSTDSAIVAEGQYECGGNWINIDCGNQVTAYVGERVDAAFQMFDVSKSNGVYVGEDQDGAIRLVERWADVEQAG